MRFIQNKLFQKYCELCTKTKKSFDLLLLIILAGHLSQQIQILIRTNNIPLLGRALELQVLLSQVG
jgi:hypothetical protein